MKEKNGETGRRRFNVSWLIILLLIVVAVVMFYLGMKISSEPKTTISSTTLESRMEGISELATVSYMYRDMGVFENFNSFYGIKLPFSTKKFILMYDGIIKAGIDMSQVKYDVEGNKVKVTIPKAKILSHEMDEESMEIYDEKNSVFNPFSIGDYKSFFADQKGVAEGKAYEKGVIAEAEKKAKAYISQTIKSLAAESGQEIEISFAYSGT